MDYSSVVEFLYSFINYEQGFKKYQSENYQPFRVRQLLEKSGADDSDVDYFHIAGTNGKGSVSYALSNLLMSSTGNSVGLYTSPHVFSLTERIRINGVAIDEIDLADLVTRNADFLKREKVTFFEAMTFLSVVYFIEKKCRYIVLETGLGGRLDSTNFCRPAVSVITPISFDHTGLLGDTLAQIAGEKAGIIKQGIPVVCAPQPKEALDVLQLSAEEKQSPWVSFSNNIEYHILSEKTEGIRFDVIFRYNDITVSYKNILFTRLGEKLLENYLTALLAVIITGIIPDNFVVKKTAALHLPYRLEMKGDNLIDVGHNPGALKQLFETVKKIMVLKPYPQAELYLTLLEDKEITGISEMIKKYARYFSRIVIFDFNTGTPSRKSGGMELYKSVSALVQAEYFSELNETNFNPSNDKKLNVLTGSFYAVHLYMDLIQRDK